MVVAAPVAPLEGHQVVVFLLQIGVLVLGALLLGKLANRLGMPAVVGELAVGVLLGPTTLDHLAPAVSAWLLPKVDGQFHLLDAVGQVGVVLLVGITGIEIDLGLARRRKATALKIGLAGLVVPLGLGVAAGFLLPARLLPGRVDPAVFALFLGVTLCVSAIPVIAKTLADMRLLHRNIGQLTLAAGMVDDAIGWLLLSVVSAMAVGGLRAQDVGLALLNLAAVLLVAAVVGRPLVRAILRRANTATDAAPAVATAVVVVVLCAAATQMLGLEAVFGAFVGGILIGSSGTVDLAKLAPLRTAVLAVFAPLFFATAGLRIDLTALRNPTVLVSAVAVLLVATVGKFAGAFLGALASKLGGWEALALGAGMNARGVIQIVVATVGLNLGVFTTETYTIVILVAIMTSVMAPPLLGFAMRRVEQTAEEQLRRRDRAAFAGDP